MPRFIAALLLIFSGVFAATALCGRQATSASVESRIDALHAEAKQAEAAGDLTAATGKYREILKLNPRLGPAYNNLGILYIKLGQYREAASVLERGLRIDPDMHSASALLGLSLFQIGDYAKARPHLEAAIAANAADQSAELMLVDDLIKLDDFESAASHLQRLAKRDPQNQQIWYRLAKVYMQLSEQALGRVNQIDPHSVWAHQISAELMESMKNYEGAALEWEKAIEISPRQPGLHYKLGDLYWSLSQWDKATSQFEREQAIDPGNCRIPWKLGDILLQKNENLPQALGLIDKAVTACPSLLDARTDRGRLFLKLHREPEALSDLKVVEQANPSEPGVHFLLAQAYKATGNTREAESEMKQFGELEQKSRNQTEQHAEEVIRNSQSPR